MTSATKCKPFCDEMEQIRMEREQRKLPIDKERLIENVLTDIEWTQVVEILADLQSSYAIMKTMQSKSFTLSDLYGAWLEIEMYLKRRITVTNRSTDFANQLLSSMDKYKAQLILNPMMICAIYMDPRFACTLSQDNKLLARSKLIEL